MEQKSSTLTRNLTLSYLCSVSHEYIGKKFGFFGPKRRSIDLSFNQEDPLIEFYKHTAKKNRLMNSAHLYLAFKNWDVPERDLVDKERNIEVYESVKEDIYEPMIEKAMKETSLENFLMPTNPLESLVHDLFGGRLLSAQGVTKSVLLKRLQKSYQNGELSSPIQLYQDLKKDLFYTIKSGALAISPTDTPTKVRLINESLESLRPTEEKIIRAHYGLDGGLKISDTELGSIFNLSKSRIGQIRKKAMKKLLHPSRMRMLRGFVTEGELFSKLVDYDFCLELSGKLDSIISESVTQVAVNVVKKTVPNLQLAMEKEHIDDKLRRYLSNMPLDNLDLSIRTWNCLRYAEIKNVWELMQKSKEELQSIEGFGRTCLEEVETQLQKYSWIKSAI